MRIIIAGNGLAGTMCAKFLRDGGVDAEIDIYGEEKYLYYPRPNLIEYLAGNIPYERLYAFQPDWFRNLKLNVHLESPVSRLIPESQEVEVSGSQREHYDQLVLATGARSWIPPIKGSESPNVFTFRSLDDCSSLIERLQNRNEVVILGGGLLGLEIARAVNARGGKVEVVEFFDRLLPRQLDEDGAFLLKNQIEKLGIGVHLGQACEEIEERDGKSGLRFKSGDDLTTESVIIAAGVRPSLELAQNAGLKADKGLVVDDYLRTNADNIFGVGDGIQHAGKVYGIIPACFEQARTAAHNIAGEDIPYEGTVPSNTLKVMGIDVTSVGLVNPEGSEFEAMVLMEEDNLIYKKIVMKDNVLVGAIWMGTRKGVSEINKLITLKTDIAQWKDTILDENFDFKAL
ncbi:NAD(P)/FAD-dependent oxidoreductase [Acidobacteriota bacterium]